MGFLPNFWNLSQALRNSSEPVKSLSILGEPRGVGPR